MKKSLGWVAERGNSDGLAYESARQTQCRRTRTSGEQHRQVRQANKTAGLKDRRKYEKKFRMGGRAVECDGLAYESARQTQCRRARTSGEQHRQVRQANKTAGLKDQRKYEKV